MRLAAVDIGNTTVKICEYGSFPNRESTHKSLQEAVNKLKDCKKVSYCTTRNLLEEEKELLNSAQWWEFRQGTRVPLIIHYDTPETLGADRLAAAMGAMTLYPERSILIADIGTALTLDVLNGNVFEGGNISPGLQMRLDALHKYTSRLPQVEFIKGERKLFGRNTADALRSGARWGVVNEIAGAFNISRREFGCQMIVLTGGGAPIIMEDLVSVLENIPVVYVRALVEEGLKIAYEFNHDKEN